MRRRSTAAWWRSRARPDGALAIGGAGEPVEWAVEMRRFDETQTLDHLADARRIDGALADALGRAVARAHAAAPVVDGRRLCRCARRDHRAERCRAARGARTVSAASGERADAGDARRVRARAAAAGRARARRAGARAATAICISAISSCIDGAPVLFDAIEFDPSDRHRRRALRSRLPADGPDRARADASRQYRAQPLSRRDAAGGGSRCARRAAAVPVAARGDPRQGHRGAARARRRARGHRAKRARLFRACRQSCWRRRRRCWSRSAGCPAPASRCSPARSRRNSARAGRGGAAQRRRAQGAVRRRRDRPPAADGLCAATSPHRSTPRSPTRRGG